MRKAQGMPLNVIIIAILGLVVLVVLLAIFTGRVSKFGQSSNTCEGVGGTPVSENQCNISDGDIPLGKNYDKITAGQICCRKNPDAQSRTQSR